jgi:glycosyltransferase 2 family protein
MTQQYHRRRVLMQAAKFLLAAGILIVLFYSLRGNEAFARVLRERKDWSMLALAQAAVVAAISLNFVRWYLLVRALELDFHLRDAFRLGALGHLLNQVAPGSVGGDLFKAMFIAREQPGRRTEAIATVVIDRGVGLYAILLVATAGTFIAGRGMELSGVLKSMAVLVAAFAVIGTVGIGLLMTPWFTGPTVRGLAERVPAVGGTLARLIDAAAAYRSRRRYLFASILVACCTHTLLVTSIWLIGRGLPLEAPDFGTTFLVGPMSLCAGAIPLTPSGLGTFEAAMEKLFQLVGAATGVGTSVAITYRAMTYIMAGIGAIYYMSARKQVSTVMHEAEELQEQLEREAHGDHPPGEPGA